MSRRVGKHNEGSASAFTAGRRPVTLVYAESHVDRAAALTREQQLKRWTRAKKAIASDVDGARGNFLGRFRGRLDFEHLIVAGIRQHRMVQPARP